MRTEYGIKAGDLRFFHQVGLSRDQIADLTAQRERDAYQRRRAKLERRAKVQKRRARYRGNE
jgi:hypothetical protein